METEEFVIVNPAIELNTTLFEGMNKVVIHQKPDVVYKKDISYEAYPMSEVLIKAYPAWKELIAQDAVLRMKATGGYVPQMPFSDGFSGRVYIATNIVGMGDEQPYECWDEGGEQHCDLGYFVIWTDGVYPDRPQPWGTYEFEVVSFENAYGDAIPNTEDNAVFQGFSTYRKYCLECHQINFVGGNKGTEHVVRPVPLEKATLDYFLFNYRKFNDATYMPDYNGILNENDTEDIITYLDYMYTSQNICTSNPDDPRCDILHQ